MSGTVSHNLKDIQSYLDDKKLIEIKANGPGALFLENRNGVFKKVKVPSLTVHWWKKVARSVAISTGQRFDERMPMLASKLPDNHRLMMVLGSNTIDPNTSGPGIVATIRLFRRGYHTVQDFGVPEEIAEWLVRAVDERENILVAGSTGSGKTTLTDILCGYMRDQAPIYIEDTQELVPKQDLPFHFRMSPTTSDTDFGYKQLTVVLQMSSPQRLVLGELNVENVTLMFRLMTMGQDGIITTLHANFAEDTIASLAELTAMNGYDHDTTESFFKSRIGVVVHCARYKDKRIITKIVKPSKDGFETIWSNPDVA